MRRRGRRRAGTVRTAAVALACVMALAAPAGAQDETVEIRTIDTSASPEVTLTVAVPAAEAEDLTADSFTLRVDGEEVPVAAVPVTTAVQDVVVVIDTSGSMRGAPLAAAQTAAIDFVGRLDPQARVAVVGFGAEAYVASGLGTDRAATLTAIAGLVASGETALWDAVVLAAGLMGDGDPSVVVLSDGGDTVSAATPDDAAAALLGVGAPLYALHLVTPESDLAGTDAVVGRAGGLSLRADDPSGLAALYEEVASQLATLWYLRFTAEDVGQVPIEVTVATSTGEATATTEAVLLSATTATTAPAPASPTMPSTEPSPVVTVSEPGFLQRPAALWIGAGLIATAILLALSLVRLPDAPRLRLSERGEQEGITNRIVEAADRAIPSARRGRIDAALERADLDLRAAELVAAVLATTVGVAVVGYALGGWALALLGLLVPLAAKVHVDRRAGRRQQRFAEQLPDTLLMLTGSLRAGRALIQALDSVAQESPEPTASEFRRVVVETRIGRDLVEALERAAERTESEDFMWAVRAIAINRELGGDLAEVLDNVADTMRERNQIARQVRSLSAEGRLSAWILLALPLFVALFISRANPGYLDVLVERGVGQVMILTGLAMFAAGGLWIRRITRLDY